MNFINPIIKLFFFVILLDSCIAQNTTIVGEEKYDLINLSDLSIYSVSFKTNCEMVKSAFGEQDTTYIFTNYKNIVFLNDFELYYQDDSCTCLFGSIKFNSSDIAITYQKNKLEYMFSKATTLEEMKKIFPNSYKSIKIIEASDGQLEKIVKCFFPLSNEILSIDFRFKDDLLISVSSWFPFERN
ncbi:MAG: hypothetical protein WAT52_10370 [Chitinophagales bacterium]